MTINQHLGELYGLPAFDFPDAEAEVELPEPDAVAWRIAGDVYDAEEEWTDAFARFLATVHTTRVRALIVGAWTDAYETDSSAATAALLAARDRLPALRALFLGDLVMEEAELSWIQQSDVTGLLTGFPELVEFGVRGGTGLEFHALTHSALSKLVVETGGLPAEVVRGVGGSDLPALEHLELWLGDSSYGADSEVSDLEPILSGARLPRLRHLGLRNSEIQDAIAAAVAAAPVVDRLRTLDLSMGTLGDEGAAALLAGRPLTHLDFLDLHHNYFTEPLRQRLRDTLEPAGVRLDLNDDDADSYEDKDGTVQRFVAIGE
ncbi:STM4015 family protein [Streptomyces sp. NPDC046860]|uniref:STM4015 family protein n=1 Tax=Streptomyces sp. NPDC046860 TaxID=3154495 RepID=UPI0033C97B13